MKRCSALLNVGHMGCPEVRLMRNTLWTQKVTAPRILNQGAVSPSAGRRCVQGGGGGHRAHCARDSGACAAAGRRVVAGLEPVPRNAVACKQPCGARSTSLHSAADCELMLGTPTPLGRAARHRKQALVGPRRGYRNPWETCRHAQGPCDAARQITRPGRCPL